MFANKSPGSRIGLIQLSVDQDHGHLKKSRCCPILSKEHAAWRTSHLNHLGSMEKHTEVLHLAAVNSHREVLPSTVKPDSGTISGIQDRKTNPGDVVAVSPTDLHLQNFRIQVPSTISAFPSADSHESGNMLQHHLPCFKSSNPFQKKNKPRFHCSHLQILRHSFLYPFPAYLADARHVHSQFGRRFLQVLGSLYPGRKNASPWASQWEEAKHATSIQCRLKALFIHVHFHTKAEARNTRDCTVRIAVIRLLIQILTKRDCTESCRSGNLCKDVMLLHLSVKSTPQSTSQTKY